MAWEIFVFSVEQARGLANLLMSKAVDAAVERGDIKTTFTNYSRRLWSEEECRIMVNASSPNSSMMLAAC